mmetsp:Transcript_42245/g.108783  ORF Transcript_42245/g.108783 Transcript_42245/m.108783 type:complete len:478 (-) Transcript_42245:502-1935(-)
MSENLDKGVEAYQKGDYEAAVKCFITAVDEESVPAVTLLGLCYANGHGVDKDESKAAQLYEIAAQQGDLTAILSLGIAYEYGKGVDKNEVKAVELYDSGAAKENVWTISQLARCYILGVGVDKDEERGVKMLREVAERDMAYAFHNLAYCYEFGKGGLEVDREMAIALYKLAVDKGSKISQSTLKERLEVEYAPSSTQMSGAPDGMEAMITLNPIEAEQDEPEGKQGKDSHDDVSAIDRNMEDWNIEQVSHFISKMGLGKHASAFAEKFEEGMVVGEDLLAYQSEEDILKDVDVPSKIARMILKERDIYLKSRKEVRASSSVHGLQSATLKAAVAGEKMTEESVFISLRFGEAMEEAKILKRELQSRGHDAYICEVAPGEDIQRVVIRRLDAAKMVIILGTRTYGMEGTVKFSTKEELDFIRNEDKPFFLIKMCDRFDDPETRFKLTSAVSYIQWDKGTPLPANLISEIEKKFASCR